MEAKHMGEVKEEMSEEIGPKDEYDADDVLDFNALKNMMSTESDAEEEEEEGEEEVEVDNSPSRENGKGGRSFSARSPSSGSTIDSGDSMDEAEEVVSSTESESYGYMNTLSLIHI